MQPIYLDHNATTQPEESVIVAMNDALREHWHNPSSTHRPGQHARQLVELARESVAQLLGCGSREVIFTSGGTESDNLAIRGSLAAQPNRKVIITTRFEHSAVRETAEALAEHGIAEVIWIEADERGIVKLDCLCEVLTQRAQEIALASVMWANNETGLIQPIAEIGAMCRDFGVRFHTDAVQSVGKMPIDVSALPIDLLTFSAHKLHGPKGIGGLYVRRGVRIAPEISGGPQEQERRGGTENVPCIVGLGAAAREAGEWLRDPTAIARQQNLRDQFERALLERIDDAVVNCAEGPRMWNTANIGFPRLEAEAILLLLSERGVCASAGAACSSGSLEPSPVLLAMGIAPEVAHGSVRFSICRHSTQRELDEATEIIIAAIAKLRSSLSVV